jgi:hypothetical protein
MPWMPPVFGAFMLIGLVGLVVWIWALVDCLQVPDDSMYRTGTKLIWVLVIVLAQVIGAIVYLAIGRPGPGARTRPPSDLPPPPAPSW